MGGDNGGSGGSDGSGGVGDGDCGSAIARTAHRAATWTNMTHLNQATKLGKNVKSWATGIE